MQISKQELVIASYAAGRSSNSFVAALTLSKSNELVNRLRTGIVHGFFQKKDGSIREFFGTTHPALAARKSVYRIGSQPKLTRGQIPFWDLEKAEWRSMRIGSFLGYAKENM